MTCFFPSQCWTGPGIEREKAVPTQVPTPASTGKSYLKFLLPVTKILFQPITLPSFLSKAQYSYNRGKEKYRGGDYKGAIADLTQLIHLEPNNAEHYWKRGDVCYELKDYQGAIADFQKNANLLEQGDTEQYLKAVKIRVTLPNGTNFAPLRRQNWNNGLL